MSTTEAEVVVLSEEQTHNGGGNSGGSTESTTKKRSIFKRKDPSEKQSRKPPGNKWLQQQIPACRPVFTALHTFLGFLIIGIAFLIMGAVFTAFSTQLRDFEVSYENCEPIATDLFENFDMFDTCEEYLESISNITNFERRTVEDCHCIMNFSLPFDIRPPWDVYYGMKNYYQNHRRYLNSWDVNQLRGSENSFRNPTADCRPIVNLASAADGSSSKELPVVPCGLIANSWFNDSFDLFVSTDNNTKITFDRTNIAWDTDRSIRFQNPGGSVNLSADTLINTTMPPNWPKNLSEITGGLQNESLMVWFRVSAFPWFRKLYGRPAVNGNENAMLPSGNYSILLTYNYPVDAFNGKKSIILAERNWLGGKNYFLGIAYLVVGIALLVIGFFMLFMHKCCSKWKLSKFDDSSN